MLPTAGEEIEVCCSNLTPLYYSCAGLTEDLRFVPCTSLTFLAVIVYEYNLLLTFPWFFWLQNEVVYTAGESAGKADSHPLVSRELFSLVGSYEVIKANASAEHFAKARWFCRFAPLVPSSLTVKTGYGTTGQTWCAALSESAVINLRLYEWWGSGSCTQE